MSFELAPANAAAVAEVCRRLDGLPLALELAGGRVSSMPLGEIARYLDDRFRLLRRPPGDHSGRHRSIEDAVRWSDELLTAEERDAFDRLSVFSGSFNLEAAAAVLQRATGRRTADRGHGRRGRGRSCATRHLTSHSAQALPPAGRP